MPEHQTERVSPVSTRVAWIVAAIALFGAFLRLYQLDYMAFHHDESIHAYYAHQIYQGVMTAYKYDPTYHGPFLYHYGALFFMLFGDSDFAARLPFVSFGILMMYFVWRLRPWIGTYGALFSMTLVALSPTMSYFSRFARNDIYIATAALGVLLFALEYFRDRKHSQLVWMTFWLALMYCIKENSYMTGFILGSFVTVYGAYLIISAGGLMRSDALKAVFVDRAPFVKLTAFYAIFSCGAFSLVYYVTRGFADGAYPKNPNSSLALSHMYNLRTAWSEYISEHAWVQPFWLFLFGGVTVMVIIALAWVRSRLETADPSEPWLSRIAKHNVGVLTAILVALTTYAFLFTTMGYNPGGMKAGVIDYLLYWMGQQDNPRIAGAPTYFLPRLFIYEIAAVLVGGVAYLVYTLRAFGLAGCISFQFVIAAAIYTYSRVILYPGSSLVTTLLVAAILLILSGLALVGAFFFNPFRQGNENDAHEPAFALDGVRSLFIYWTLTSVLIYAMLHEKVPWLLTHQAFPLLILAGIFLGDVFVRLKPGVARNAFLVVVVVVCAFQARTSILLNFYNPDSPRELMVYTQSDQSVKRLVDEMERAAYQLGPDYRPVNSKARPKKPIAVIHDDPASWPYSWYLRNYNFITISSQQLPPSNAEGVPFAILNPGIQERMAPWTKGKYIKQQMPHRVWWPIGQSELPFEYYQNRNRPIGEAFGALWRYMLRREMWNENDPLLKPGSSDVVVYRRHPFKDPETPPDLPKGYDQQPRPLEITAQVGGFGTGPGQFNEPRGIALSPDEKTLYVLDAHNARVQVFDCENDLRYVTSFGELGTGDGQLSVRGVSQYDHGPSGGIDVGPDGTIYITDTWRYVQNQNEQIFGRIVRLTKDGEPLPSLVPPDGPFFFPRGLAVDKRGVLYVADTGANRIVRFAPDGTYLGVFLQNIVREPVGVIIDKKDDTVYVCDVAGKRVVAVNPSGQFVKDWTVYGWAPNSEVAMQWIEPYIGLDPAGNIFVTDSTANMIHAFLKTRNEVVLIGGTGSNPGNLNRPKDVLIDSRYQVYIADSKNNRVIRGIVR